MTHVIQSGDWRGARDVLIQSGNWRGSRDVVIQSGNWRVARNTVWELEGVNLIQPGNWRGARDAGNSLVKTEKTYNPAWKKSWYQSGTGQIYRDRDRALQNSTLHSVTARVLTFVAYVAYVLISGLASRNQDARPDILT